MTAFVIATCVIWFTRDTQVPCQWRLVVHVVALWGDEWKDLVFDLGPGDLLAVLMSFPINWLILAPYVSIQVADRSKANICGRSLPAIAGLDLAGDKPVSCVLLVRGLCDGPITRPEVIYRLWCLVMCVLEIWRMGRPWPALGCLAIKKISYGDKLRFCVKLIRSMTLITQWTSFCALGYVSQFTHPSRYPKLWRRMWGMEVWLDCLFRH
jgi:hypothetical protein